jgi:hypothetical protein
VGLRWGRAAESGTRSNFAWRSWRYLPVVVGAAVVGDHVLRLLFSDGTAGDINFSAERCTGVLTTLLTSLDPAPDHLSGTIGSALSPVLMSGRERMP